MLLTMHEKEILKDNLRQYLLSVLAEEEDYNTLEKCREEVRRTQDYLLARGRQLAFCASEWLRGLPIGVEFSTWKICVKIFNILGWKYDPLFSLGGVTVEANGKRKKFDTYDLDCLYGRLVGEIIAEGRRK